jgi:MHS family shikimate/dehydroshikimate transporter-like MFS transporter
MVYAAAFVVRPVGAVIFGGVGDRCGRRISLIITLILMGCATVLTGCLPNYDQVGWVAPAILVVLRVLMGLSIGAEYTTAVSAFWGVRGAVNS